MADHHIPLPTNRHGRGDSAAQAGARRGAALLCSGHLPGLHAASFKVQPRSVSRADPFSGRFRVDIEYRRRKRTGGRNVPAPSRSVDAHVRDQRYGM